MTDGFIKAAAGVPEIALGNPAVNADRMIAMLRDMHAQGVKIAVFTELGITGYTLEDLFLQQALLDAAETALRRVVAATADMDTLVIVGVPVPWDGALYNCAAVINRGRLIGLVPKTHIPTYAEFYEGRRFSPAPRQETVIRYLGQTISMGQGFFRCAELPELVVGVEICEDAWVPFPPSVHLALAGANVICNLSCSNEVIGKAAYRRELVRHLSASQVGAYVY
ncbi:MAG: NAD(+) synthase, partial [Clostridia bacterium]|nr:NAD(+) synthase [Clostridia bacterium]